MEALPFETRCSISMIRLAQEAGKIEPDQADLLTAIVLARYERGKKQ